MVFIFIVVVGLVCAIVFVALQIWAIVYGRKRIGLLRAQALAFLCPAALIGALAIFMWATARDIDLNPVLGSTSEFLGTWVDQSYTLTINEGNEYHIEGEGVSYDGHWNQSTFTLSFDSSPYSHLRIIKVDGEVVLLKVADEGDPDTWDLSNLLHRK